MNDDDAYRKLLIVGLLAALWFVARAFPWQVRAKAKKLLQRVYPDMQSFVLESDALDIELGTDRDIILEEFAVEIVDCCYEKSKHEILIAILQALNEGKKAVEIHHRNQSKIKYLRDILP